jgi:hypothetical protein
MLLQPRLQLTFGFIASPGLLELGSQNPQNPQKLGGV